ncbi:hypothetical protein [Effusibacillus lacus]|uniref:Lipoprotein n=1 Tax=Effusibacillus lacus TaxID=1348429 RepID=A0A292YDV5_9BACL|nr:hypothetical protein [Effusibacillus lacus]TCS70636.1 hypothetical protein EDD64_13125 [Effusibacillus lacus]GAX90632.1 hypothetical protein [Effusibacillus lacus]
MRKLFGIGLLVCLIVLGGCNNPPQALPKTGGPVIKGVIGQGPISELDLPSVERQLLDQAGIREDTERPLVIRQTVHTKRVSYVLYSMPNNDGLAVVTKQGNEVKILERIPVPPGDPNMNLVSYNTIIAGNPWDPDNGVLFGMVYNPYITSIETFFRDTSKERIDVTNSRGFIVIRPGTDTRFVQINAIGKGGLWWTKDTR